MFALVEGTLLLIFIEIFGRTRRGSPASDFLYMKLIATSFLSVGSPPHPFGDRSLLWVSNTCSMSPYQPFKECSFFLLALKMCFWLFFPPGIWVLFFGGIFVSSGFAFGGENQTKYIRQRFCRGMQNTRAKCQASHKRRRHLDLWAGKVCKRNGVAL